MTFHLKTSRRPKEYKLETAQSTPPVHNSHHNSRRWSGNHPCDQLREHGDRRAQKSRSKRDRPSMRYSSNECQHYEELWPRGSLNNTCLSGSMLAKPLLWLLWPPFDAMF